MSLLFTKVDGPDKSVLFKEDASHIEDKFEDDSDIFEHTWTNENIDSGELPPSSDDGFDIRYAADITIRVRKQVQNVVS